MTMRSDIQRDALGNITIRMQGGLDYEYCIPLREELTRIIRDYPEADITIDLAGMDFVGSSGIAHFVETIRLVNSRKNGKVGLSNVNSEFQKVFRLFKLEEIDIIADKFDMDSDETFTMGSTFGNRKRTFEN
jgi:anti-sigma B factor antagonist